MKEAGAYPAFFFLMKHFPLLNRFHIENDWRNIME